MRSFGAVEIPEALELTRAQELELDRRLDACRKTPTAGSPWQEVMDRVLKRPPTRE
jgi:putative addiction module component (TIGR02574 family)